jgi:hypothetical protein
MEMAMPLCQAIAAATPNRTDDEILACYQKYGLSHLFDANKDKGVLLHDLAVAIVQDTVKDQSKVSLINLAIEVCVGALKQGQKA